METTLYGIRFLHYVATMTMFGGSLFRVIAAERAIDRTLRPVVIVAAIIALLSAAGWLMLEAASMGDGWPDAIDLSTLETVLNETQFGHLWRMRLVIALLLFPLSVWGNWKLIALLSGLFLASLADEGHGGIGTGTMGILHIANQGLHLLSGGAWLGGLLPLALLLRSRELVGEHAQRIVNRFSGLGYAAVSIVLATGCINTGILAWGGTGTLATSWGLTLVVKLIFVAVMVGFAVFNRAIIVPGLSRDGASARDNLRHKIYAEIIAGMLVLAAASVLGTLAPPNT